MAIDMSVPRPARPSHDLAAKLFRGLGDGSRLEILQALREGPQNVSEVVAATGLSQPSVSTHLSCLWCCGLVAKARQGRFVYYRVRNAAVRRLLAAADRVLDDVAEHIDACERYADAERPAGGAVRGQKWA
jgi:ArsR family transcriptional regulator, cadmium/lead-responsive transcriptional repressor